MLKEWKIIKNKKTHLKISRPEVRERLSATQQNHYSVEIKMADKFVGRRLYRLSRKTIGSTLRIMSLDCGFSTSGYSKRTVGQRNE